MLLASLHHPLERRCKVFPADEVTSLEGSAEVEPEAGGLTRKDVEAIWGSVVSLYESGIMPAVALCLRRHGQVVIDRAIGHARGNEPRARKGALKVQAKPTTLFNLFSASKAVTAMLVHLLDERGDLHLDDAVADYIPEFGKHGKEWVTIRHVLTHRAGIPTVPGYQFSADILSRPDEILRLLCETKPTTAPGRRLAYHALTGGFVLGEIIRRVSGRDIQSFLTREVRKPSWVCRASTSASPRPSAAKWRRTRSPARPRCRPRRGCSPAPSGSRTSRRSSSPTIRASSPRWCRPATSSAPPTRRAASTSSCCGAVRSTAGASSTTAP
ncbi:MAG: beta-lactamase family protein [Deltaproteobacteria bacterium]|nr:beta-lactamase family protein [Deltaproteobacteria bacterium]